MRIASVLGALMLGACSGERAIDDSGLPDLDAIAIERGVIADPDRTDPSGLYARGGDRLCLVPRRGGSNGIGLFVTYGEDGGCRARGSAMARGNALTVTLASGCSFTARADGSAIAFPGKLPDACARLCSGRASLDGVAFEHLSESIAEAQALRDPEGQTLCGS